MDADPHDEKEEHDEQRFDAALKHVDRLRVGLSMTTRAETIDPAMRQAVDDSMASFDQHLKALETGLDSKDFSLTIYKVSALISAARASGMREQAEVIQEKLGQVLLRSKEKLVARLESGQDVKDVLIGIRLLISMESPPSTDSFKERGLEMLSAGGGHIMKALEKRFSEGPRSGVPASDYAQGLSMLIKWGQSAERQAALELLTKVFVKPDGPEEGSFLDMVMTQVIVEELDLRDEGGRTKVEISADGSRVLEAIAPLGRHGWDELLQAWIYKGNIRENDLGRNLRTIRALESEGSGITSSLQTGAFHIRHFGRYDTATLIRQANTAEMMKRPYVAMFYPLDNRDGAFNYAAGGRVIESLSKQLEAMGISLRIAEVDGKEDFKGRIRILEKKYGAHAKPVAGILGGHGETGRITFGLEDQSGADSTPYITTRDVETAVGDVLAYFFQKGAPIYLDSCSTGAPKGIGEKLSGKLENEVVAPNRLTGVNDVRVRQDEGGQLFFDVDFDEPEVSMRYRSGERVIERS